MRVLVTGGSGAIGAALARHTQAAGELDLVLADVVAPSIATAWPYVHLDVTDREACVRACRDVDAVIHLAADPDPEADLRHRILPLNVVGSANVFDAAVAAGCQRVVFASSGQVVLGYDGSHVPESAPPRPINDYGAGKAFGEALCSSYAARSETIFVAVRIGAFAASPLDVDLNHRDAWLSHRDAAQLLQRGVLAPLTERYLVVNGISGNTAGRLSLERARAALGYAPQDDASTWA